MLDSSSGPPPPPPRLRVRVDVDHRGGGRCWPAMNGRGPDAVPSSSGSFFCRWGRSAGRWGCVVPLKRPAAVELPRLSPSITHYGEFMARHHRDASRHVWTAALCLLLVLWRVFVGYTTTTGRRHRLRRPWHHLLALSAAAAWPAPGLFEALMMRLRGRRGGAAGGGPWRSSRSSYRGPAGAASPPGRRQAARVAGTWRMQVGQPRRLPRPLDGRRLAEAVYRDRRRRRSGWLEQGDVVSLESPTWHRQVHHPPDSKWHPAGASKLPIGSAQSGARTGHCSGGAVQPALGGEKHGEKCSGDSCPVVRSRRSVDKASGQARRDRADAPRRRGHQDAHILCAGRLYVIECRP